MHNHQNSIAMPLQITEFKNLHRQFKTAGLCKLLLYRIINDWYIWQEFKLLTKFFSGKRGLEVGGPSSIFSGSLFPIYSLAGEMDNCNFSTNTVWEGKLKEGYTFNYHKNKYGFQFINEAIALQAESNHYDFLISSNMLEHVANPIKALNEFKRVVKPNSYLLLIVPHGQGTPDYRRPITKLNHILQDYRNDVDEHDLTHMPEIVTCRDYSTINLSREQYLERSRNNYVNRCLHHHVFNTDLLLTLVDYVGLQTCFVGFHPPGDIVLLCKKTKNKNNSAFFDKDASWRKLSPFSFDHRLY